ncbi:MAG: aspartate carbamoyltransferase catalytic subunit [Chloroflexi bacterium]|nr:aspartate carbamoyltransferase catalytic subunit [Chloroflexota bacterium]MYF79608.1 aspartate carbamoyltransferase catalytic subunit [Chloroflexota bacterium]MYK60964.1 aspartate carbamoyltransferase catalytic subunit [Chloroflexota bacterium]
MTNVSQQDVTAVSADSKHLLDVDSLTPEQIHKLRERASEFRQLRASRPFKSDSLRGGSIYTLFFENSTRTRVSFEHAGKALGADVINIAASTSSVSKGESLLNTVLTLDAMGIDALIVRHPHSGSPHFIARHVDAVVINAGDGAHGHPTQALLDVLTLQDHLGNLQGAKLALVGDILYSRVARSDIIAFRKMGVEISIAGPPTLLPQDWAPGENSLGVPDTEVTVHESVEDAIRDADAIMCLRLQLERQTSGLLPDVNEYSRVWGINAQRLALAKPGAPVMHPGPMNEGLEISTDIAHGSLSLVENQVENGVAMRMAVLEHYCGPTREIL